MVGMVYFLKRGASKDCLLAHGRTKPLGKFMSEENKKMQQQSIKMTLTQKLRKAREQSEDLVKQTELEPANFSARAKAIMYMAALGFSTKEISAELGMTQNRVSAMLSSQSAKKKVEELQYEFFMKDPQKMFMQILPKAVKTAKNIMLSRNSKETTRVDAAFKFMDRALGKPVQEIKHEGNAIKTLFETMDKINKEKNAPKVNGEIIDASFTEVKEEPKDDIDSWIEENLS